MKNKLLYSMVALAAFQFTMLAQGNSSLDLNKKAQKDNIVMTWNKNTPESEMKDDIKALSEHGLTITYSDVKRNDKGEITAIKVNYTDKDGSKGSMSLDSQKPINTIKVYKQDDEVGFGEPEGSEFTPFAQGFNAEDMMKGFQFNSDAPPGQQFNFNFPNGNSFGQSNSKIIIKQDGKKPLVIQDGTVVEGGDDYTKEELEEIKKNNKVESWGGGAMDWGSGNLDEQMKQLQEQMDEMNSQQSVGKGKLKRKSDLDTTKEEMLKAKEEMENAKKELENAKKELESAKSSLKTQKT